MRGFYRKNNLWLPEILKANGYKTIGIDWLGRWHRMGFDHYWKGSCKKDQPTRLLANFIEALPHKYVDIAKRLCEQFGLLKYIQTAASVTKEAVEAINGTNEPFFLFVHYWDTHTPYYAPGGILRKLFLCNRTECLEEMFESIKNEKWKSYLVNCFPGAKNVVDIQAIYDEAVKYVDGAVGRLLDCLRAAGKLDNTLVIVTADHGESLGEHGIYFDHHGLYDSTIRVPLIMSGGGFNKSARISGFVQHIDLAPTVMQMLGVSCDKTHFDGVSFLPLLNGRANGTRSFVVAEEMYTEEKYAIRTGEWKYIYSPSEDRATCRYCGFIHGGVEELYNLADDPAEECNVMDRHHQIARELKAELLSFYNNLIKRGKVRERGMISGKVRRLKAAGLI
ncbi:hypothetical protein A6M21_11375 [Desulfotomaculum copahuensis]|uniref:Sulfatase N-terminal domain-containing protein n=1 Tax=Desulfotomaculum copahuensis TaxID=1838280 RepID=A0A1B7LDS6_9FIRM|nr:hypothetical protein A6M21_11375 [Desulfotomaculum copahuensis]